MKGFRSDHSVIQQTTLTLFWECGQHRDVFPLEQSLHLMPKSEQDSQKYLAVLVVGGASMLYDFLCITPIGFPEHPFNLTHL